MEEDDMHVDLDFPPEPIQCRAVVAIVSSDESKKPKSFGSLTAPPVSLETGRTIRPAMNVLCKWVEQRDYVSYFEISVVFLWIENRVKRDQTISWRLFFRNYRLIEENRFKIAPETTAKYAHVSDAQWTEWCRMRTASSTATDKNPDLREIHVRFTRDEQWASGIWHCQPENRFGPFTALADEIADLLNDGGDIFVLVNQNWLRTVTMNVRDGILENAGRDPIYRWYPGGRPMIRLGQGPKPEILDNLKIMLNPPRLDSFVSYYDYANILIAGTHAEQKLSDAKAGPFVADLRLIGVSGTEMGDLADSDIAKDNWAGGQLSSRTISSGETYETVIKKWLAPTKGRQFHEYLLFLDIQVPFKAVGPNNLSKGDTFTINFEDSDEPADAWTCVVTAHSPYASPMDICAVCTRKFGAFGLTDAQDDPIEQYDPRDLGILTAGQTDFAFEDPMADVYGQTRDVSVMALKNYIQHAEPLKVKVRFQQSNKERALLYTALSRLGSLERTDRHGTQLADSEMLNDPTITKDGGSEDLSQYTWIRDLLVGTRLDRLPVYDFFQGVSEETITNGLQGLTDDQVQVMHGARKLPGGLMIVEGPAGTGKTHLMVRMCFILATQKAADAAAQQAAMAELRKTDKNRPEDEQKVAMQELQSGFKKLNKVMVVCRMNEPLNMLAVKIAKELATIRINEKPTMVIRLHAWATELAVVKQDGNNKYREQYRPKTFKDDKKSAMATPETLHEMQAVQSTLNQYMKAATRLHKGIWDKRLKRWELSLGYWILVLAGLISTPLSETFADPTHFVGLASLWNKFSNEPHTMSPDETQSLTQEINRATYITLERATVICTTVSNAADSKTRHYVNATHMLVDESSKLVDADLPRLFAFFENIKGRIFFGNTQQLGPLQMTSRKTMAHESLAVGPVIRLMKNGIPPYELAHQHRFNQPLGDMQKALYYPNSVIIPRPKGQYADLIGAFFRDEFGLNQPLVLVNNSTSMTSTLGTSKVNTRNLEYVFHLIKSLLGHGLPAGAITYLTGYHAQLQRFGHIEERLQREMRDHKISGQIQACKIDQFQGNESPFVILDLVITDDFGFMDDSKRLCNALTRATDGLVVIGAPGKWRKNPKYRRSSLLPVVQYFKAQQAKVER